MVSYQGAVTRFNVACDGLRINAEMPASADFKEGDSVRLIWPKTAMVGMEGSA